MVDGFGLDRLRVHDRRADIAEGVIHGVGERVDRRWHAVAGDDQALAAVRLKIFRHRRDESARGLRWRRARGL